MHHSPLNFSLIAAGFFQYSRITTGESRRIAISPASPFFSTTPSGETIATSWPGYALPSGSRGGLFAERLEAGLFDGAASSDEIICLSLAKALVELDLQFLVDPSRKLRTHRLGAAHYTTELQLVFFARLLDLAQHLQRRRRVASDRRSIFFEQAKSHVRIEARLAPIREHRNSVRPNREQPVEQTSRPRPIGGTVIEVAVAQVIVRVVDPIVAEHITRDVQHALGIAGGARGVHQEDRILGAGFFHREARRSFAHQIVEAES